MMFMREKRYSKKTVLFVISLICQIFFGVSAFGKDYRGSLLVRDDNAIETIHVQVGHQFTIKLESNMTAGYQWQLANPIDKNKLKLISSEFKIADSREKVGTPGMQIWIIESLVPGQSSIEFQNVRPWEKSVKPVKTKKIIIFSAPASEEKSEKKR
jgi:inhibitor of cysteine peptidase